MTQYYLKRGMRRWMFPFAYLLAVLLAPIYLLIMLVDSAIEGVMDYYRDHVLAVWDLLRAPFTKDFWKPNVKGDS